MRKVVEVRWREWGEEIPRLARLTRLSGETRLGLSD